MLKLTQQTKRARGWKMMLNYYEMYSPRLIRAPVIVGQLQIPGNPLHSKANASMKKTKMAIMMICITQGNGIKAAEKLNACKEYEIELL